MSGEQQWWYNLTTGQVELGYESPAVDRAGPFATAEEAGRALEIMRERSRQWDEDDAADDED